MNNIIIEKNKSKNAAPANNQESSKKVNNRDAIPTDYCTINPTGIKTYALQYVQCGLCAIPPVKGEKRPVCNWTEYQCRYPTEEEWTGWANSDAVGIVCGAISRNLLVLDFDQQGKAFESFKEKINPDLFTGQTSSKAATVHLHDRPV